MISSNFFIPVINQSQEALAEDRLRFIESQRMDGEDHKVIMCKGGIPCMLTRGFSTLYSSYREDHYKHGLRHV